MTSDLKAQWRLHHVGRPHKMMGRAWDKQEEGQEK